MSLIARLEIVAVCIKNIDFFLYLICVAGDVPDDMCEQGRLRSVSASSQSGQNLLCLNVKSPNIGNLDK